MTSLRESVTRWWSGQVAALVVEDAGKFLGVLAWALYFVFTSGEIVTSIVTELRDLATRTRRDRDDQPGDERARDRTEARAGPQAEPASSASSARISAAGDTRS